MTYRYKRKIIVFVSTVCMIGALCPLALFAGIAHASGGAVLYLSPALKSFTKGGDVSVSVRLNTHGIAVNAIEADFSYTDKILRYESISDQASAFDISAPSTGGNGTVKVARGSTSGKSGDLLIATVHFKAIEDGHADLQFLASSMAPRFIKSTDALSSTNGAIFTIYTAGTKQPSLLPPIPSAVVNDKQSLKPGGHTGETSTQPSPPAPGNDATDSGQPVNQKTGILASHISRPVRVTIGAVAIVAGALLVYFGTHHWLHKQNNRRHVGSNATDDDSDSK